MRRRTCRPNVYNSPPEKNTPPNLLPPNFFQEASCFHLSMEWTPPDQIRWRIAERRTRLQNDFGTDGQTDRHRDWYTYRPTASRRSKQYPLVGSSGISQLLVTSHIRDPMLTYILSSSLNGTHYTTNAFSTSSEVDEVTWEWAEGNLCRTLIELRFSFRTPCVWNVPHDTIRTQSTAYTVGRKTCHQLLQLWQM